MSVNAVDIICKKRDGKVLNRTEIETFIKGYSNGEIPDYQAAALLMAIYFSQMSEDETFDLARAMRDSGDIVDLSDIAGTKVDKHSTGGVGDKVTLIVAPIAAACGVPIAKMSGRGLGFTGGTVDKLESIPGFRTSLEPEAFHKQVNEIGIAVIGQSGKIAPADKKLYALRDVTGTVENLSLIASSIMSKKLAAGSDAILLDVKCGKGAFMKSEADALKLAELMCKIGISQGKKMAAIISDMSCPLGEAVGNSLEVIEAIEVLKGNFSGDLLKLCLNIAAAMIVLGEKADCFDEAYEMASSAIASGSALKKLSDMIEYQGGDSSVIDDYSIFRTARLSRNLIAQSHGYIAAIDAEAIGLASQYTGAGRTRKEDEIDYGAGIKILVKVGDKVKKGDIIAKLYSSEEEKIKIAMSEAASAFDISDCKPEEITLIKNKIGIN